MSVARTALSLAIALVALAPQVRAQTQAAMNEEARAEYTAADRELNRVYNQVIEARRADAAFVRAFRNAQRAWVAFRDAHVEALYPAADKPRAYGSTYPLCRWQTLTQMTRDRTAQLKAWTEPPEEGDVCAGSRQSSPPR